MKFDAKFDNLEEVLRIQREQGGSIVLYKKVWSAFVISVSYSTLVHVPPGRSRLWIGLKQSLLPMLAGWWSLFGVIRVGSALGHNLIGGLEVTIMHREVLGYSDVESESALRRFKSDDGLTAIGSLIGGLIGFGLLLWVAVKLYAYLR